MVGSSNNMTEICGGSCNKINNDGSVTLNPMVFNDILPLILYDCKFQRLLDLSLVSKSVFKLVQLNVTFKQNQIKFYPYGNQFLEYIKSGSDDQDSGSGGDNKNQSDGGDKEDHICNFKLIQFNKLSILYLKIKSRSFEKLEMDLIKYCNALEKVHVVNYIEFSLPDTIKSNHYSGFFQFEKVFSYWDPECPPYSTEEEGDEAQDLDFDFEPSFEYLRRINPKKFKFSTSVNDMDLHLYYLNNILNCKSLESIKFGYHNTIEDEFIVKALSSKSPQLKELTIRPCSGKSIGDLFIQADITNNKSLRKLILRQQVDTYGSENIEDPSFALQQLIGNTSIQVLGLELYEFDEKDYKLLSPLIQIPNIQEIRCNLDSAMPFILHCNENPNIKVLQIKSCQHACDPSLVKQDDTEKYSKYITKNPNLQIISVYQD